MVPGPDVVHVEGGNDDSSSSSDSDDAILYAGLRNVRPRREANANRAHRARSQANRARAPANATGRARAPAANAANRARSPANAANRARSPANRRLPLGGFLSTSGEDIRSPGHASALIGLLQLAGGHSDGILAALGHNNRSAWFSENIDRLFQAGGPLGAYTRISTSVLQRHLGAAQRRAKLYFDRDHADGGGQDHEDIPGWARAFFRLFEAQASLESGNQRTANARNERNAIVASIVGRQAPLGARGGSRPEQLRNELSRNDGAPSVRRQVVGNVNAERVPIEGRDDEERRSSAPRRRTQNGVRRRNRHVPGGAGVGAGVGAGFDPDENNPAARFAHIRAGYSAMNRLTETLANSLTDRPPIRSMIDITRDYVEIRQRRQELDPEGSDPFFARAMQALHHEQEDWIVTRTAARRNGPGGDAAQGQGEDAESGRGPDDNAEVGDAARGGEE